MNILAKCLGSIFTVLFIYAAMVQFNDVDAVLWIVLYSIAAIVSILFVFGKIQRNWALILAVSYIVLAVYYWPIEFEGVTLHSEMKTKNVEMGRESLGMAICGLAMVLYFILIRKRPSV